MRWGITTNLTLNGTIRPDFAEVESDAGQLVADPRQALFFPEKRPFFLDGIEQFTTPNQLIYTRRIVAPLAAAKITGKVRLRPAGAGNANMASGAIEVLGYELEVLNEAETPPFPLNEYTDVGEETRLR